MPGVLLQLDLLQGEDGGVWAEGTETEGSLLSQGGTSRHLFSYSHAIQIIINYYYCYSSLPQPPASAAEAPLREQRGAWRPFLAPFWRVQAALTVRQEVHTLSQALEVGVLQGCLG